MVDFDPNDGGLTADVSERRMKNDSERAALNSAVLHNLSLAHIALGEYESSVTVLLRAASLRREYGLDGKATKMYWNAPHDVLKSAEEKALLIAVKAKAPSVKERVRRTPFLK